MALSALDWRLAMCSAATVAVLLLLGARRRQGVGLLPTATCGFFLAMAVIAVADPTLLFSGWYADRARAKAAAAGHAAA